MTVSTLEKKSCVPCKGGVEPLKGEKIKEYADQLNEQWQVVDEHHLERDFKLADFREALDFVNEVGALAEEENHHPDIEFGYGKVKIKLWSHKIGGLHENDFILASKIDQL